MNDQEQNMKDYQLNTLDISVTFSSLIFWGQPNLI